MWAEAAPASLAAVEQNEENLQLLRGAAGPQSPAAPRLAGRHALAALAAVAGLALTLVALHAAGPRSALALPWPVSVEQTDAKENAKEPEYQAAKIVANPSDKVFLQTERQTSDTVLWKKPTSDTVLWKTRTLHAEADILIIGDSHAQASKNYLEQVCKGKKVNNLGVGGTTALQWSQNARGGRCAGSSIGACSIAEAFSPKYGRGYTHLWISLGGNDFLMSRCTMSETELQHRINEVVKSARAAAGPNVTIVLLGYPRPTEQFSKRVCPDLKPGDRKPNVFKDACATDFNCRFVETAFVDGARSYDEFSSGHLHADGAHLNAQGYCALFTMKEVQDVFQCEPATHSC